MISFKRLSQDDAWTIIKVIKEKIEDENKDGAVAVVDEHGELMAFYRTDNCGFVSVKVAINKAFTAVTEGKTTFTFAKNLKENALDIAYLGDLRFTALGGGVPVYFDNKIIGGVAFSGLSQEEDEEIANFGISKIKL
jgi:glc operon protein GlcG